MIRSMEEFVSAFRAARCVSTPLVGVRTADPASTTQLLMETLKQGRELPPLLGWDVIRGLFGIGKDIGEELARVLGDRQPETVGPAEALFLAQQLCEDGLLFYSNAHRFWNEPGVMQGIWNLRDSFKATGRMLVLLTVPGATLHLSWRKMSSSLTNLYPRPVTWSRSCGKPSSRPISLSLSARRSTALLMPSSDWLLSQQNRRWRCPW